MELIKTINDMKVLSKAYSIEEETIGYVPTMGALHEGHLSLVDIAKKYSDKVILSIFVNPIQFSPKEDFKKYPRTLEGDLELSKIRGVDVVFYPSVDEMYPEGFKTDVQLKGISSKLCGKFRPNHFNGVTTVVLKLFNIINPKIAIFGEKDFQQLVITRKLVQDLNLDVEIVAAPIVRDSDGLAMSSRNIYLAPEERKSALSIFKSLKEAQDLVRNGLIDSSTILKRVRCIIENEPICNVQYASICSNETLDEIYTVNGSCRLAVAVLCGKTRLIDNIQLDPNEKTDR